MSADSNLEASLLFVVEDTFNISSVGLVVISKPNVHPQPFKSGSKVTLKKPDGSVIESTASVQMATPNTRRIMSLALPGLSKDDVPMGTEIWFTREGQST